MSVHASSWAWQQKIKDDGCFRLLLSLADMANDEHVCWPSLTSLRARLGGVSQSTVQRRVRKLQDEGYIAVEERKGDDGRRSSNLYTILVDGALSLSMGDQAGDQGVLVSQGDQVTVRRNTPRVSDLSFEALVEVTGFEARGARGLLNQALRELRAIFGETHDGPVAAGTEGDRRLAEEIRLRAAYLKAKWRGSGQVTPASLVRHWGVAGREVDAQRELIETLGLDG